MFLELAFALLALALTAGLIALASPAIIRSTGSALPEQDRRLGHLDGLRGVLASMVAVHHFSIWVHFGDGGRGFIAPDQPFFANLGRVGVSLFFMISAALFYERVTRPMTLRAWSALYTSRFFRIVPLYVAAIGVVLAIFALQGHRLESGDGARLVRWLLFLGTPAIMGEPLTSIPLNVSWTLRFEWLLYASLPLIWLAGLIVRAPAWRLGLLLLSMPMAVYIHYIPACFLFGMMAVEIRRSPGAAALFSSRAAGVIGIATLAAELFAGTAAKSGLPVALSVLFLGLAFLPAYLGSPALSLLSRRRMVALGEWSYGIYLLHNTVYYLLFVPAGLEDADPSLAWLVGLPLSLATTVLVAAAAHGYYEKPFIRLGHRLSGRRSASPPLPAAQPVQAP